MTLKIVTGETNIRVRGVSKTVATMQIHNALQAILTPLLKRSGYSPLLIEHIEHLVPTGKTLYTVHCDVICRVHYYTEKESIMAAARVKPQQFEGHTLTPLPDLSRKTLALHRSLKPFLEVVQAQNIKYRWGYTFPLTTTRIGKSANFCIVRDLSAFLTTLEHPQILL